MKASLANILVFALAIAVAAAGCGGSDDEPPLTKAEFIKQADAICKRADKEQLKALGRAQGGKSAAQQDKADEAAILDAGLSPVQKQAEELGELGAPEGDEEKIKAIVVGMEDGVKKAEENPSTVFTEGQESPFVQVDELSKKYGFKVCSEAL